jgi:hypothetical protein
LKTPAKQETVMPTAINRKLYPELDKLDDSLVKLEIVSCDEYRLVAGSEPNLFPLPYLSCESCFMAKLLANADRTLAPPFKDVFDLVAMSIAWGEIPPAAWQEAERQYGTVPRKTFPKPNSVRCGIPLAAYSQCLLDRQALGLPCWLLLVWKGE